MLGFGPDRIRTMVTDSSHMIIMGGGMCLHDFSIVFDWIFLILAGNDDIHKNLDEFEIRPDPTTDDGVSCP